MSLRRSATVSCETFTTDGFGSLYRGTAQDVSRRRGQHDGSRERDQKNRRNRASVERVRLNDGLRPAVGWIGSKWLPETRPPDLAALGYHFSPLRISSESASAAGPSFGDVLA